MAVCSWCGAEILDPDAPCTACGKRSVKVPSLMPLAPARSAPAARRPVPAPPALARAPKRSPAEVPAGGARSEGLDEDEDIFAPAGGPAIALELDVAAMPSPPHPMAPPSASFAGAGPGSMSGSALPRGVGGAGAKSLVRPGLEAAPVSPEEEEARSLADYGPAPTAWWQAPLYTYRVKMRQAELRRIHRERKGEAAKALEGEEDATVSLGERARPLATKEPGYAKPLEAIAAAETVLRDRDKALAADMDAHQERIKVIDQRVASLEAELAAAKAEEHRVEEEVTALEATRQRAEAKVKRAEIELRNVAARAEPKRAGGPG